MAEQDKKPRNMVGIEDLGKARPNGPGVTLWSKDGLEKRENLDPLSANDLRTHCGFVNKDPVVALEEAEVELAEARARADEAKKAAAVAQAAQAEEAAEAAKDTAEKAAEAAAIALAAKAEAAKVEDKEKEAAGDDGKKKTLSLKQ